MTQSITEGHMICFWGFFWLLENKAAVNIPEQVFDEHM